MMNLLKWILPVGGILLMLAYLLVRMPFTLQVTYKREGEKDEFTLSWLFLGHWWTLFRLPKVSLSTKKLKPKLLYRFKYQKKEQTRRESLIKLIAQAKSLFPKFRRFLRVIDVNLDNFQIHKLQWVTRVGAADALETALLSGGLWSLKYTLLARLYRFVKDPDALPRVNVVPFYGGKRIDVFLDCIVTMRPGHIIIVGLWRAGIIPGMFTKEGEGRNESSYRGADADGHGESQRDGRRQYGGGRRRPGTRRQPDHPRQPRSLRLRRGRFRVFRK
ncbi:DUF2953 domain-containing protein [Heliobacillus mobilis]|uniref:DUF2953 domain-containing protein n=1 Tax=Heliobacterium mobile TaxID=28064 RepID=A0A6I3SBE1_HELMO|nr:DUF2953 domain-containing protein [Heliobacterium mobile]